MKKAFVWVRSGGVKELHSLAGVIITVHLAKTPAGGERGVGWSISGPFLFFHVLAHYNACWNPSYCLRWSAAPPSLLSRAPAIGRNGNLFVHTCVRVLEQGWRK